MLVTMLTSRASEGVAESVLAVARQDTVVDRQGAIIDRQGATTDCQHSDAVHVVFAATPFYRWRRGAWLRQRIHGCHMGNW
jgi:hypothetical protein